MKRTCWSVFLLLVFPLLTLAGCGNEDIATTTMPTGMIAGDPRNIEDGDENTFYGAYCANSDGPCGIDYEASVVFPQPTTLSKIELLHSLQRTIGLSWSVEVEESGAWNTVMSETNPTVVGARVDAVQGMWTNVTALRVKARGGGMSSSSPSIVEHRTYELRGLQQ